MSLFKTPSNSEGGNFFRPAAPGMFKGTLVALEPTTRTKWGSAGEEEPAVRWKWEFRNLDGSDILDPNTGKVAIVDARTSTSLHKRATGRKFMEAHLQRPVAETDDPDVLAEEAMGKDVMLQIAPNTNNNLAVAAVLPFVKVG